DRWPDAPARGGRPATRPPRGPRGPRPGRRGGHFAEARLAFFLLPPFFVLLEDLPDDFLALVPVLLLVLDTAMDGCPHNRVSEAVAHTTLQLRNFYTNLPARGKVIIRHLLTPALRAFATSGAVRGRLGIESGSQKVKVAGIAPGRGGRSVVPSLGGRPPLFCLGWCLLGTRRAMVARSTSSARSPASLTLSQINSTASNFGSVTSRHDGCARKSNTARFSITQSSAS